MKMTNTSEIVNKVQLSHILGVSRPTATKMYQTILDSLQIKERSYLMIKDLIAYGIL